MWVYRFPCLFSLCIGYGVAKQSVMQAREKLQQYNRENYMYRPDANQGKPES